MWALTYPLLPVEWGYALALGAILTSFGRLAVYRLPHQLGWREAPEPGLTLCAPASRCEHCAATIRMPYLLPVLGWCLARGRCVHCGARISFWHPLLELIGGLGWVAALAYFGWGAQGLAACLLWQVLLFLAEIDWREHWLPAVVTYPLFWLGLLLSPFEASALSRIIAACLGFSLMWGSMTLASRMTGEDAWSGGDIALCAAVGAWLGVGRFPQFLLVSVLLFVLMALPLRGRGQRMLPMGPALAAGWLISLCLPAL